MDVKESATLDATNFTTEQVISFFDETANRYREALKLAHTNKGTPRSRNSSGIIILQNNDEVEVTAFGSEITLNDVILNTLISRAKEADTDDVAALLTVFADKLLNEALTVGNFTYMMEDLALPLVGNTVCDLIKKVKGFKNECPTD